MQAGFYRRGYKALKGGKPPAFRFLVQETTPPYSVAQFAFDGAGLDYADYLAEQAVWKWGSASRLSPGPAMPLESMSWKHLTGCERDWRRDDDQAHAGTVAGRRSSQREELLYATKTGQSCCDLRIMTRRCLMRTPYSLPQPPSRSSECGAWRETWHDTLRAEKRGSLARPKAEGNELMEANRLRRLRKMGLTILIGIGTNTQLAAYLESGRFRCVLTVVMPARNHYESHALPPTGCRYPEPPNAVIAKSEGRD